MKSFLKLFSIFLIILLTNIASKSQTNGGCYRISQGHMIISGGSPVLLCDGNGYHTCLSPIDCPQQ